jgi:tRNA threonylcarbamoyl adenosine modification protein (Sua5/YciO/YrdC/YwlC family)
VKEFELVKKVIDSHGVLAFQTDTIMGIGCNGADNASVRRMFEIKQRPLDKPLYLLAYSMKQIVEYTSAIPDYAYVLMEKYFPGGLTLILNSSKKLYNSPDVIGDTIGVRIPNAAELIEFLAYIDLPILNTSANISGSQPLKTPKEVYKTFDESVFFVQFEYNIEMSGSPSTIVDCMGDAPKIIREGSVKI